MEKGVSELPDETEPLFQHISRIKSSGIAAPLLHICYDLFNSTNSRSGMMICYLDHLVVIGYWVAIGSSCSYFAHRSSRLG